MVDFLNHSYFVNCRLSPSYFKGLLYKVAIIWEMIELPLMVFCEMWKELLNSPWLLSPQFLLTFRLARKGKVLITFRLAP